MRRRSCPPPVRSYTALHSVIVIKALHALMGPILVLCTPKKALEH